MTGPAMGAVATVAVPATSANLGPGFDAFGLALSLEDEVTAQVTDDGYRVSVSGEGCGEVPIGQDHLIVGTMLRTFGRLGLPPPAGLNLTCSNRIPHARGLGSSSAAIVAGILLARALAEDDIGRTFDDDHVLALAAELEGHPDNVAACLLGGFTIAWMSGEGARAVRLDPAPGVQPVLFIPTIRGLTEQARSALPPTVPYPDAVFNLSRAALLVHAITARPDLLLAATDDRLHQPYRAAGMPETADLVGRLRSAGVPAMVSGAGPTVLALPTGDVPVAPPGWWARSLSVSATGARIVMARHAGGDPVAAGPRS